MYIILFLHQTTTQAHRACQLSSCISSFSYIKPQPWSVAEEDVSSCISSFSYIKPQLFQARKADGTSCISSFSYIKPQLLQWFCEHPHVVYHPFPTSNHNCSLITPLLVSVVYHPFPTSNHNHQHRHEQHRKLYIILFLHQTTTGLRIYAVGNRLYIILFLHQTTTIKTYEVIKSCCISSFSYIKPQPFLVGSLTSLGCISSFSYIKPQRFSMVLIR